MIRTKIKIIELNRKTNLLTYCKITSIFMYLCKLTKHQRQLGIEVTSSQEPDVRCQ